MDVGQVKCLFQVEDLINDPCNGTVLDLPPPGDMDTAVDTAVRAAAAGLDRQAADPVP